MNLSRSLTHCDWCLNWIDARTLRMFRAGCPLLREAFGEPLSDDAKCLGAVTL